MSYLIYKYLITLFCRFDIITKLSLEGKKIDCFPNVFSKPLNTKIPSPSPATHANTRTVVRNYKTNIFNDRCKSAGPLSSRLHKLLY